MHALLFVIKTAGVISSKVDDDLVTIMRRTPFFVASPAHSLTSKSVGEDQIISAFCWRTSFGIKTSDRPEVDLSRPALFKPIWTSVQQTTQEQDFLCPHKQINGFSLSNRWWRRRGRNCRTCRERGLDKDTLVTEEASACGLVAGCDRVAVLLYIQTTWSSSKRTSESASQIPKWRQHSLSLSRCYID
jgi:hypothetical protein